MDLPNWIGILIITYSAFMTSPSYNEYLYTRQRPFYLLCEMVIVILKVVFKISECALFNFQKESCSRQQKGSVLLYGPVY